MDIRKRKVKGIFVLSVLIILCLCTVSVLTCFTSSKSADAISDLSSTTNIGELLLDNYATRADKMVFNGSNLELLYKQLTGTATYEKVKELAPGRLNCDNFYTQNGNKAITVMIDNIVWNAVYLSTNRDGDPILTLWQARSSQTAQWNYHSKDENANIPSSMYGTSMIRTITLNAGGRYYTSNDGSGETPVSQDASNTYAKFTMDSVTGSLTDFIDKPANVEWQERQISHTINTGYAYDFNNDAYGNVGSGGGDSNANWFSNGTIRMVNFYGKTDYSAWSEDYIWLPSMAEAGWRDTARGLWRTHALERGNASGIDTWLRSASSDTYRGGRTLLADGSIHAGPSTTSPFAVRPAFHLNLRKAEEASNAIAVPPETLESVYDTNVVDLTSENWYTENLKKYANMDGIEYFKVGEDTSGTGTTVTQIKNAGVYKVKFSIKDPTLHLWKGGGSTKTLTYTVKQKTLGVNFNADVTPPTAIPTGLCPSESSSMQNSILRIRYTDGKGYDAYVPPQGIEAYTAKVEINTSVS
ncbi:MAG: hypothetical protein K2H36_00290, partial [Clostridia bacterium]|nr:hypothetical protein [Clostridia bacterium]